jgi:hypothetical protein
MILLMPSKPQIALTLLGFQQSRQRSHSDSRYIRTHITQNQKPFPAITQCQPCSDPRQTDLVYRYSHRLFLMINPTEEERFLAALKSS